jgi:predicted DNA-binding transcriptional regulator AlpA
MAHPATRSIIAKSATAPNEAQSRALAAEPGDRLIRTADVLHIIGACRATLYRMIQAGEFPSPIRRGSQSRWLESDARNHVRAMAAKRAARMAAAEATSAVA